MSFGRVFMLSNKYQECAVLHEVEDFSVIHSTTLLRDLCVFSVSHPLFFDPREQS